MLVPARCQPATAADAAYELGNGCQVRAYDTPFALWAVVFGSCGAGGTGVWVGRALSWMGRV